MEQINPTTGKTIRLVSVVKDNGSTITVKALFGPLAGTTYDITPDQLRRG